MQNQIGPYYIIFDSRGFLLNIIFKIRFFCPLVIILWDKVFQSRVLNYSDYVFRFFFLSLRKANFIRWSFIFVVEFEKPNRFFFLVKSFLA